MTYCTVQGLIDVFGETEIAQLTNRGSTPASSVNEAVAQRALDQAEAEINTYLEGRYSLPLSSTPSILVQAEADIARYYLHLRIDEDHPATMRYRQRISHLRDIAKGVCSLALDTGNAVVPPADTVQVASGRNDFGGHDW